MMFNGSGIGIEPIVFKKMDVQLNNIRLEYHVDGNRVQFHLWGDPEFPENTGDMLSTSLKTFPKDTVIVDFVPEVGSWYVEVNNLSVSPTEALVKSIVKKIAKTVNRNA